MLLLLLMLVIAMLGIWNIVAITRQRGTEIGSNELTRVAPFGVILLAMLVSGQFVIGLGVLVVLGIVVAIGHRAGQKPTKAEKVFVGTLLGVIVLAVLYVAFVVATVLLSTSSGHSRFGW